MERTLTEKNDFSYNLARPLLRDPRDNPKTKWRVIEKGSKKSDLSERCKLSFDTILSAQCQIKEHIWLTACNKLQIPHLLDAGFKIYLKEELYQFTETVKARGVVYSLLQLSDEQKRKGVVATSTGGFAYSLCYFGKKFGIPVTVVLPLYATDENIRRCKRCGDSQTTVFVQGHNMIETHTIALRIAMTKGLVYIDGNDYPNMIIGQATLGTELFNHWINIDAVILPTIIENCSLTAGIAMAIKEMNSNITIIEVRPTLLDPLIENVRRHMNLPHELGTLKTKYIWHENSIGIPQCWFNKLIMVNEILIEEATNLLLTEGNIVNYHAAIGIAAILSGELDELMGKRVILPLFGNIDSMNELIAPALRLPEFRPGPSRLTEDY